MPLKARRDRDILLREYTYRCGYGKRRTLRKISRKPYESTKTIGFVIEGKAELYIEGQRVLLEPGDSWVIPIGAKHRYKILVPFTAIEVTNPPAEVRARDT
jgi:mannose-6-phosphate isomerase-like protein (cupin superfamily)